MEMQMPIRFAKRFFEYLSERLSSFVIICLSFTCATLAVILFYIVAPRLNPIFQKDHAENAVVNIVETTNVDAALYVQINLDTNSRKFIASSVKDQADQIFIDAFKEIANKTRFTAGTNPMFVYSMISGNVVCQDKTNMNPSVKSVLSKKMDQFPDAKICSVPVLNSSYVLVGYISVLWKKAPSPEEELATIIQAQTEVKQMH